MRVRDGLAAGHQEIQRNDVGAVAVAQLARDVAVHAAVVDVVAAPHHDQPGLAGRFQRFERPPPGRASAAQRFLLGVGQPRLSTDHLAIEPKWDVQDATVGVTPLAPTIRVGALRTPHFALDSTSPSASGQTGRPLRSRLILNRPT